MLEHQAWSVLGGHTEGRCIITGIDYLRRVRGVFLWIGNGGKAPGSHVTHTRHTTHGIV
jgi:hypothetical protein